MTQFQGRPQHHCSHGRKWKVVTLASDPCQRPSKRPTSHPTQNSKCVKIADRMGSLSEGEKDRAQKSTEDHVSEKPLRELHQEAFHKLPRTSLPQDPPANTPIGSPNILYTSHFLWSWLFFFFLSFCSQCKPVLTACEHSQLKFCRNESRQTELSIFRVSTQGELTGDSQNRLCERN